MIKLEERLKESDLECAKLKKENQTLKKYIKQKMAEKFDKAMTKEREKQDKKELFVKHV